MVSTFLSYSMTIVTINFVISVTQGNVIAHMNKTSCWQSLGFDFFLKHNLRRIELKKNHVQMEKNKKYRQF